MRDRSGRIVKTLRMKEDIFHQAKVAAVISRKSIGQWMEEAVSEKVRREADLLLPGSDGDQERVPAGRSKRTKDGS